MSDVSLGTPRVPIAWSADAEQRLARIAVMLEEALAKYSTVDGRLALQRALAEARR